VNGIENLGSTCYANTVIQQIANIPEFVELLLLYPIELLKHQKYDYADDILCQL